MYLLSLGQIVLFVLIPLVPTAGLALWYLYRAVKAEHQLRLSAAIIEELSDMVFAEKAKEGTVMWRRRKEDV
jgi:hypothetical protein